ncbi:uncharacterized protein BJY16_002192 [Actinoplanes octamycinicus]|uniref:HEXXH motif-containing protein n=1 Tax=Actinoplanes octamycinicus TaxID=135948 RepID=A0A7W7GUU6_9ACTN|nr:HEXXH motif domain-containing protein [Actinoplanes octamycinicus]MBB4738733.1 uncharacterized protein [Actinoplanes octamycinicus]GIE61467.1 hypothetical protein Aoc01nite_68690 [Actinoplanes octamycinicus]
MIRPLDLGATQFTGLAGGYGGAAAVRALAHAQLSKHLLLIKFVVATWTGDPEPRDRAVDVLTRAQSAAPEVVADLLTDPLVGAWLARTTRRLRGAARSATPLDAECNHLSTVAAAAAALAGIDADLIGQPIDGGLALPRLGRVTVDRPGHPPVAVTVRAGRVDVAGASGWAPVRRLTATTAGQRLDVVLDDLDPYRGGHHAPPADRLGEADVRRWQEVFAAGWALIAAHDPDRAGELAAGLRTLVPLARLDAHSARSATIRDAFGAFGLTRPATAAEFAVMLVHEFQHSKLSGVLDLRRLTDPGAAELHFAPWRTDPRPVGGLFQGVYAFLGIAQLWARLAGVPGLPAQPEFALAREQVRWGLDSLAGSAALTADGRRFAAGMRAALDELAAVPVPAETAREAEEKVREVHAGWQERLRS